MLLKLYNMTVFRVEALCILMQNDKVDKMAENQKDYLQAIRILEVL